MAIGLQAIIAQVIDQVPRATPTQDATQTFSASDDGAGGVLELEQVTAQQDRIFDVRITGWPRDDGEASGTGSLRMRATLAVRVYYWLGGYASRTALEQRMAQDVSSIVNRLAAPVNWDATNTGTDAWIFTRTQPTASPLKFDGSDPKAPPDAFILSIPFEVIYREASA